MKPRVTSKDVAKLANVSQATVSYVLNNNKKQSISEETRQKILDAAKELNYTPSIAARTLKSNKTNCIIVAISKSLRLPRYSYLIQGIRSILEDANYNIMLCNSKKYISNFPNYLDLYLQQRADAIIYIGANGIPIEPEAMNYIISNKIPLVVFGYEPQYDFIPSVDIDYFFGAYEGVKYLISRGYKNLIYFDPKINTVQNIQRKEGVLKATKEFSDITLNMITVPVKNAELHENPNLQYFTDDSTYNEKYTWINDFMDLANLAISNVDINSAFICSWPRMTEVMSRIFTQKKLDIPVLTLEKINMFANGSENFIFSCLPNYDIGKECAKAVLRLLNNSNDISKILLKPKLETNTLI